MIKGVIFDMAGTAIDENNIVYKTLHESLNHHQVDCSLEQVLQWGAGHEKRDAISILAKKYYKQPYSENFINNIFNHFKVLLNFRYETEPLSLANGMKEVIHFLKEKDIKIAFNTGYQEKVALQILDRIGIKLGKDIDVLVTADMVANGRPAPDMIQKILQKLGITSNQAIKIGDSQIDIEEGRNASVAYSLGITTGAHTREQLEQANPDLILSRMEELVFFISELE